MVQSLIQFLAENLAFSVWLAAYGSCALSLIVAAASCIVRGLRTRIMWLLLHCSAVGFCLVLTADVLSRKLPASLLESLRNDIGLPLIAALSGVLVVLAARLPFRRRVDSDWWNKWGQAGSYTALFSIALALTSARVHQLADTPVRHSHSPTPLANTPPQRLEVNAYAMTDSGHRIALYGYDQDNTVEVGSPVPDILRQRVILHSGKADLFANCHGWIFTGGRYVLSGRDIDQILLDNSYTNVESPQPGDLIVYRDYVGTPVHTGLVKATGIDDFVLIESKWGPCSVYLHSPEDQIYSQDFEYYRSERANHLLVIFEPSGPSIAPRVPVVLAEATSENFDSWLGAAGLSPTVLSLNLQLPIPWRTPTRME